VCSWYDIYTCVYVRVCGVCRLMRHPGYAGFMLWSVSTQIMLANPVCFVAFCFVLWRFFEDRIPYPVHTHEPRDQGQDYDVKHGITL